MKIFESIFKKYSDHDVLAVCSGEMIPLENAKDPLFSMKTLGDGIAIIPESNEIVSPVNGEIVALFPTGHAFGVVSNEGAEYLIHIGIDTVSDQGENFTVCVKKGDKVKAGQKIIKINLKKLRKKYDMTTMVIITNQEPVEFIEYGHVRVKQEIRK